MKITNPAFDYDRKNHNYSEIRKADPRIGMYIQWSLKTCDTVLNVGAGTGSYEPDDKYVIAVEPSYVMRAKRLDLGRNPAINAKADNLPFDDQSFDGAMAVLTIHHWPDLQAGLLEIKRVSKKKISILTYDPEKLNVFWNAKYFPQLIEIERNRYPKLDQIAEYLGEKLTVTNVKIPLDCTDGFQEAFYGRPEAFLQEEVRNAQSAWGFLDKEIENQYVKRLSDDLASGEWDRMFGYHRKLPEFEGAFRLLEIDLN
ncbi:MAG TPA: class I SAM-dependent methyltransferase [Anaerolineales bacterium]|nr:class I SAM-dependent methyltransferase [Anaerolineales bacterium]